ncbi:hypothetical protein HMN09_00916800 [Mycena chlorophos]|uniref:Uncharacterized protein n=1 Tax=Mycena chlorophos TaxID=658473 RepID=A0A8H6SIJ4_MYCCL|nr:hypothetical protein HMN09_00916800 [Mycena chlorophos]
MASDSDSSESSTFLQLATSTLVALFVESVLYGMFCLLFALAMSVLLTKRKRNASGTRPLLGVSITMFLLSTVHIATDLKRAMQGFLFGENLTSVSSISYLLKDTVYILQTIIGDGFMIYRVYLVWNGDRRVVFPLLILLLTGFAVGIVSLDLFAGTKGDNVANPIYLPNLHAWVVSFFSLTLFTNAMSTLLIAGRIYTINLSAAAAGTIFGRGLGPAIMIVVESGLIYTVALAILLGLYMNNSYATYILVDGEVQIVGIVFTMIIVRVGMGLSSDREANTLASTRNSKGTPARYPSAGGRPTATLELTTRGGGVHVETSTEVKTDLELDSDVVYGPGPKGREMWGSQEV